MKKSNKLTVVYVCSSLVLFFVLVGGGVYGLYLSIGLSFVRSGGFDAQNNFDGVANVSYGGSVNFSPNMTGVIMLSVVLIILSLFDLIAMIKQIVFFKQFKFISNSKIEQMVERKIKSKGGVVFFVVLVDILSLIAGVLGLIVNMRSLAGGGVSWVLYLIDALIVLFALISLILLIMKLKKIKKFQNEQKSNLEYKGIQTIDNIGLRKDFGFQNFDIDECEYLLLKLKYLKLSKLISLEEYQHIRNKIFSKQNNNLESNNIEENKKRS